MVDYSLKAPKSDFLSSISEGKDIGRGCFGKVAQGYDLKTHTSVAIKIMEKDRILHMPNGPQSVENELRVMERLPEHPSILKFYGWYDYPESVFIKMEVFSFPTLRSVFNNKQPTENELKPIIQKLIGGVMALHKEGIYHQDIQLGNILYDSSTGNLKLIDFGLAALSNEPVTGRFEVPFSISSSTEVALNKPFTPRTADIWQIGALIYECLTGGHSPFRTWANVDHTESKWKLGYRDMASLPDDILETVQPYFYPQQMIRKVSRSRMEIARLDVINRRYFLDVSWSDDLKSLLRGIFQPAENRLSLSEVSKHPWFD